MKPFNNKGFGGDRGGSSFNKRDGGRPSFGGNRGGQSSGGRPGGFGGRPQQMFQATCASCGNTCEVPFRPNGEKPVYCNNCFGKQSDGPAKPFGKRDFGSRDQAPRPAAPDTRIEIVIKQMDAIQSKLDILIKTLESGSRTARPVAPETPKKEVSVKAEAPKKETAPKAKPTKPAGFVKPTGKMDKKPAAKKPARSAGGAPAKKTVTKKPVAKKKK